MYSVDVLKEEIKDLEIEIDALQDSLWNAERALEDLQSKPSTPEEQKNQASIEPSQEEKELSAQIISVQTELTARRLRSQALKKKLADVIATESEYFSVKEE